jgi:hypothetical protein
MHLLLWIIFLVGLGLSFPKVISYGCSVPLLGFMLGTFLWILGGSLDLPWANLSRVSFSSHVIFGMICVFLEVYANYNEE